MQQLQVLAGEGRGVAMRVHELHPRQFPLSGLVHKHRGEADIVVDETTVVAQETQGFLGGSQRLNKRGRAALRRLTMIWWSPQAMEKLEEPSVVERESSRGTASSVTT